MWTSGITNRIYKFLAMPLGRVVRKGLDTFLWEIPGFTGLPKEEGIWFISPDIRLPDSEWRLAIYPNGTKDFHSLIILRLWRRDDHGPAHTFHCTVGVVLAGGEEQRVGTHTVKFRRSVRYVLYVLYKRVDECEEGEFLSSDTLTITLRLRKEGEAASQGPSCTTSVSLEGKIDEICDVGSGEENEDVTGECKCPKAKGVMILSKHMKELLAKGDDCDVRIRVKDKEFSAHRNILKSRSPVFRMMLTHECQENNSGVITIVDCDADAFGEFLSYMYCGKTGDLTPNRAFDLYYIADKYSFPELKEQCVIFLKTSLSTSNICDVILLSAKHGVEDLLDFATNFFARNIDEILVKEEWQNFLVNHPREANELYIKSLLHIKSSYKVL